MPDRPRSRDEPPAPPCHQSDGGPADPVSAIIALLAKQIVDDHYPDRDSLDPPEV